MASIDDERAAAGCWTVAPDDGGARLDAFVARVTPLASVASAKRLIAEGRVTVDGKRAAKGARVQAGQQVAVAADASTPATPRTRPDGALHVLAVDDDFVAIAKPAGLPSCALARDDGPSAADAIAAQFPECADASPDTREAGLVHRLDNATSGVLVAARSREAWQRLREAFKSPGCEKVYVAEVVGVPPGATIVTAPIGRAGRRSGRVRVGSGRGLMPARTEIALLERRAASSLVEARLQAGRPHQVRAHLAHLGCPVLGDDRYSDDHARRVSGEVGADELRLHAERVTFVHPRTSAVVSLEAPRPAWARVRP